MMRVAASHREHGATLIAALFLIVALGALGLFAVRIGSAQQATVDLAMQSDRAVAAANLGIEWAAIATAAANACAATSFTPGGALNGYTVDVQCLAEHDHGVDGKVFVIRSTARFGAYGSPTFVSRTRQVRLPG